MKNIFLELLKWVKSFLDGVIKYLEKPAANAVRYNNDRMKKDSFRKVTNENDIGSEINSEVVTMSYHENRTEDIVGLKTNFDHVTKYPEASKVNTSVLENEKIYKAIDYENYLFGIDLGTSSTKISYNKGRGGEHTVIKIGKNGFDFQMPSLVYSKNGEIKVGEDIEFFEETERSRHIKLKLGMINKLSEQEKREVSDVLTEIFKEVIKRVSNSREFSGLEPGKMSVNISTSSTFDLEARQLFLASAQSAGLTKVSFDNVVEEPIAAGLAYIETYNPTREPLYILVCDYGGGTFDCSLISIRTRVKGENEVKEVNVLATAGVLNCGGVAIDSLLYKYFLAQLNLEEKSIDTYKRLRLLKETEEIKKALSTKEIVEKNVSDIINSDNKKIVCERAVLDRIIDETQILNNSLKAIEWVIRVGVSSNNLEIADYDVFHPSLEEKIPSNIKILFVGGTSNIPYIKEIIQRKLNLADNKVITKDEFPRDPIEAVVLGDSYSRAFGGINLNRPPYRIILEINDKMYQIQECFEGFLTYKMGQSNNNFANLAIKRWQDYFSGKISVRVYFCDHANRRYKFFKEQGAYWQSKEEDKFDILEDRQCRIEIVRSIDGKIIVRVIPQDGASRNICSYASPWCTDNDLSNLSTWFFSYNINWQGRNDEPG
ncbi:MAG: Hsp70 family protein [Candidatus Omnitrophota bacterium]